MRLISVHTKKLTDFIGQPPPYTILSHTWGDGEVTLPDMCDERIAAAKRGFYKIHMCCKQAIKDDLEWIWVDTCCIDKTSSSELSEAINSMYQWYKKAEICYAYLSDVPEVTFKKSRWFTRGWTLQELIAPYSIQFYDNSWNSLGSKQELAQEISQFTGIHSLALMGDYLDHFSVAQKMFWASNRVTTKEEDIAYSLLGLFGINMPLLYGEGEKNAFLRLQAEISCKKSMTTLSSPGVGRMKRKWGRKGSCLSLLDISERRKT
ncbi:heterokaryon incompatibility protein-domain-containing protein [Xylogone sp. PMI_703]|nr:heterokaryon incompatibility protein-domain-containing protein [Xylogone sp. PMI_703]